MGCCGGAKGERRLEPFCIMVDRRGAALPVRVEKTAAGIRFLVTHGGLMHDLLDAVRSFSCHGVVARAVEMIQRNLAAYQLLAAPLVGQTTTLAHLTSLRT